MLFNSYEFIFSYLPVVFFGFFAISKIDKNLAALWLVLSSLFFYAWWDTVFVTLLLGSITLNFFFGLLISKNGKTRRSMNLLICAVTINLIILGYFKYVNFFLSTINQIGINLTLINIVLPLGISFFTFTQIAFLVDSYRGIAREYSFVHYLLFVTWFPHLIAGPVLHHKQMMPQFNSSETYRLNFESISIGLTLFSIGLFKKVILADQFAVYATPFFASAENGIPPMLVTAWGGVLAYALQLYFDFSGYSDMAIGLSRMFNIKLPVNFNSPYKSENIIEFWRRWHMTLSAFLRDYLYIPLGGNRKGHFNRYTNILTTMVLGGLWHGAGWNFLLWGGLHGILLIINQWWRSITDSTNGAQKSIIFRTMGMLSTFVAVLFAWVPFRATSLEATYAIWSGMLGVNGFPLPLFLESTVGRYFNSTILTPTGADMLPREMTAWLILGISIVWLLPNSQQWLAKFSPASEHVVEYFGISWKPNHKHGLLLGVAFGITLIALSRASEFLYFQF